MSDVLVLRHVQFEDLGAFAPVLERRYGAVVIHDLGVDDLHTRDPEGPGLLIVLGGPIGVYEEETYPFLVEETEFIARRLTANRPMIGICLGAQLIAKAAGARVYPSGVKEIGFGPIAVTVAGHASCLAPFEHDPITLHWHGDTFDLPEGATLLASTDLCINQAFAIGKNIVGFQFHPEAGGPGFERWLIGHTAELSAACVDIGKLRSDAALYGPRLARKAEALLNLWLDGVDK